MIGAGNLLKTAASTRVTRLRADVDAPLIYQPYFSDAHRQRLHAKCEPFDGSFNTGTTNREYELFQHLMKRHTAENFPAERFWGLVSSKFEGKSPVSMHVFLDEAAQAQAAGYDGYVLNPMIGNAAIFINVWEQGFASHKGLTSIHALLASRGFPVNTIEGPDTFAFCNYVCGNARFWTSYFHIVENILGTLEAEVRKGSPAGIAYRGEANYQRDPTATMRPFVIERLLGVYLQLAKASGAVNVAYHVPTEAEFLYKFGPRISSLLHPLYGLKAKAVAEGDQAALSSWRDERVVLLKAGLGPIWELDDPPAWMPNGHSA